MSTSRKNLVFNTGSVKLGCGSCIRPKLSHIFHPKPKPKNLTSSKNKLYNHSSSSNSINRTKSGRGFGKNGREGVAVEKDSNDPYLDFKHSMLQMILENEISSKDDLRELLNCFLQLNSPYHHGVIVRAFTEIWNGVYSVRSKSPTFHFNPKLRT